MLLKNGKVVDPSSGTNTRMDVLIEDGKIAMWTFASIECD